MPCIYIRLYTFFRNPLLPIWNWPIKRALHSADTYKYFFLWMNKWRRDQASFTGDLGPSNHMGPLRHCQATFILGWERGLSGSIRISPVSIHRYGSLPEISSPHYWSWQDLNVNPSVWDRYDPLISGGCCCLVGRSYPPLCNPMNCSPPGSSVHRIFQARILE